jgi:hypothetical protein
MRGEPFQKTGQKLWLFVNSVTQILEEGFCRQCKRLVVELLYTFSATFILLILILLIPETTFQRSLFNFYFLVVFLPGAEFWLWFP